MREEINQGSIKLTEKEKGQREFDRLERITNILGIILWGLFGNINVLRSKLFPEGTKDIVGSGKKVKKNL